jgi:hypothetical protein
MHEKALGDNQMQMILGSSHGDIEQAAFFLDLCSRASGEIRGDASIYRVQKEYGLPLLPLRRVNGR